MKKKKLKAMIRTLNQDMKEHQDQMLEAEEKIEQIYFDLNTVKSKVYEIKEMYKRDAGKTNSFASAIQKRKEEIIQAEKMRGHLQKRVRTIEDFIKKIKESDLWDLIKDHKQPTLEMKNDNR